MSIPKYNQMYQPFIDCLKDVNIPSSGATSPVIGEPFFWKQSQ
jgi:hypothetical protein